MFLAAIDALARHEPAALAVSGATTVTYAALDLAHRSLAVWLARQGLQPGDPVGLTIRDEYRHLVASLALMRLGCPHIVIQSGEPPEYRRALAARLGTVALLAEDEGYGLAGVPLVRPDFDFVAAPSAMAALPAGDADAAALYLTSSGTTGRAKVIPISQRQFAAQARRWQWPAGREVFYRANSIEFNNTKRQRLYALAWGSTNVLADPMRVDLVETCERWGVTRMAAGAVQVRALIDRQNWRPLPEGVHLRLGGQMVGPGLRAEIRARLTQKLHVTYATSEFGSISTAGPGYHATHADGVGAIHPGVALEIVDDEDRAVPAGSNGRIRVRAEATPTRYFDDEQATGKAFRDGWFYPGDVGRLDEAGFLYFEGRADDMLNLATINIFPAEIERVVDAFPGVVESAVFAMHSEDFGDIPLIAVVARPGVTALEIQAYARQRLGLRAPRKVFLVEALPRNSGGKVMRDRLRELAQPPRSGEKGMGWPSRQGNDSAKR
jgi:acyl-coenzyme A synthetase/AMP-(fatty) acid ligase